MLILKTNIKNNSKYHLIQSCVPYWINYNIDVNKDLEFEFRCPICNSMDEINLMTRPGQTIIEKMHVCQANNDIVCLNNLTVIVIEVCVMKFGALVKFGSKSVINEGLFQNG